MFNGISNIAFQGVKFKMPLSCVLGFGEKELKSYNEAKQLAESMKAKVNINADLFVHREPRVPGDPPMTIAGRYSDNPILNFFGLGKKFSYTCENSHELGLKDFMGAIKTVLNNIKS